MQPCIGALYDPAGDTQTTAMFGTSSCNYRGYPALLQCGTVGIGVVSAVALQCFGFVLRAPDLTSDRRNAVNEWQQLSDVVVVGGRKNHIQRNALRVRNDVVLAAR